MTTDTRLDIPLGYTYDDNGYVRTFRDTDGSWYEYTRNANDYVLTYKNSDGYSHEYTRNANGNVLTYKNSNGTVRTAIAYSDPYTLYYDTQTSKYHAGCREFTRAEALAHWSTPRADNAERAALFHAAITNHNPETE
jgi:hypothetical protein